MNRGSVSSWQPPLVRQASEREGAPACEEVGFPPAAAGEGRGGKSLLVLMCLFVLFVTKDLTRKASLNSNSLFPCLSHPSLRIVGVCY